MKLLPFSFLRMLMPRPMGVDGDAAGGGSPAAAPAPDKIFIRIIQKIHPLIATAQSV